MSGGLLPCVSRQPVWFPFDPGEVRGVGGDEIGAIAQLIGELTCAQFTVVSIWLPSQSQAPPSRRS
jgi:hypothetical protein